MIKNLFLFFLSPQAIRGERGLGRQIRGILASFLLLPNLVLASANLDEVQFSALPGNQVRIDLIFSAPVPPPKDFSTDFPARIVLDFAGVANALGKKRVPISVGPVQSLVALQSSGRTRVVVNLSSAVPYRIHAQGSRILLLVNDSSSGSQIAAPSPSRAQPSNVPHSTPSQPVGNSIQAIDFRRGPKGEGRVLVTLPSPDTRVTVSEKGRHVLVQIQDVKLPSRLLRRLDVTDFATPVTTIESLPKGRHVQIDIQTGTEYEYLAYQADRLFTVEFRPLTPQEKQRLEQQKPVYTGDRLSLNFQNIEVRAVLQLLADFTGLNLVASDTVTGNITLRLKNVPWDQALDIILKTKGLSMRRTDNVIRIAPTEEIAAQEKLELESKKQVEDLAPLHSEFIQINYAKAQDIADLLKSDENNILTPDRGNVTVDARTNTLIVQDTAARLEEIRRIVHRLDVPVRQVMIESRIVVANNDFARDLGVRFGYELLRVNRNQNTVRELSGSLEGTYDEDGYWGSTVNKTVPLLVDLPATTPSGGMNLLIGKIGSYLLQLELTAMQREGRGEIISSPRVITSDKQQATIKVGKQIPYQESSASGGTTVKFKDAVLQLDVTPQITPDDRIILTLNVEKNNADFSRSVNGVPPIDTRAVKTSVLVDNGETVVLGGVYEQEKAYNREQVPWLGSLPILGHLFRSTTRRDNNEELLIFVTPKILKDMELP